MSVLAFLLECGATAAIIGAATSLIALAAALVMRSTTAERLIRANVRADLLALIGCLPAVTVMSLLLAVSLPSFTAAVTGTGDHCLSHGHHLHLCILHAGQLRPILALLGATALAFTFFRVGTSFRAVWLNQRRFSALERLGEPQPGRFPLIRVPGAPRLCHAVGVLRRRVLLSATIEPELTAPELAAALAHERAHLVRHDPLVGTLLRLAAAAMPASIARRLFAEWQRASEEACDAHALTQVEGGHVVASALVKMTALQRGGLAAPSMPAFGESSLERRIRLLLHGSKPIPNLAGPAPALLAFLTMAAVFLAVRFTHLLHHAVETALHLLS